MPRFSNLRAAHDLSFPPQAGAGARVRMRVYVRKGADAPPSILPCLDPSAREHFYLDFYLFAEFGSFGPFFYLARKIFSGRYYLPISTKIKSPILTVAVSFSTCFTFSSPIMEISSIRETSLRLIR